MRLCAKIAIFIMVEKTGIWCHKYLHNIFKFLVNADDWEHYMTIRNGNEVKK